MDKLNPLAFTLPMSRYLYPASPEGTAKSDAVHVSLAFRCPHHNRNNIQSTGAYLTITTTLEESVGSLRRDEDDRCVTV